MNILLIGDSAAPAAHVDNLMDSQNPAAHRLPTIAWISHNTDLTTGAWKTHNTEFSTLSTISITSILNLFF